MRLGIDAGAYSIKFVLTDEKGNVIKKDQCSHHNKVKECAARLIEKNIDVNETVNAAVTGSMSHLLNMEKCSVAEQKALCKGFEEESLICKKNIKSMILLGAQHTCFVEKSANNGLIIKKNSNCSAGTGAFFEEQAGRLQIKIEDISSIVKEAKTIPQIAGRCSVFSKTDMIHLMQEGVPVSDILLGLCHALIRNFKSTVMHNQKPAVPVFLAGGLMKNEGVVDAIKEQLSLNNEDIVLDEMSSYIPAFGASFYASEKYTVSQILENINKDTQQENKRENIFKPLYEFVSKDDSPDFIIKKIDKGERGYLGIDIGSTSINLVVLNDSRDILYFSYVKTLGKPLDIVREELEKLKKTHPDLIIEKTAVTGSGREYVGNAIGAELIINEISAQTEGTLFSLPDTETVFEIGGQDSKYMSISGGRMSDFEMNKVCAAGTGAFLEEQIKKLGITMNEFLSLAMKSKNPCLLGDRCTVFIEGSINRALSEGNCMEDVCAGLAYAIASNYLHRVVNQKPVGNRIAVQGGIAYNKAVVCAFRAITGKQISVTPYFSVTGALGAASLLTKKTELVFDKEHNQFLNAELNRKSEASYLKNYHSPVNGSGKKVVGVPRVIFLHKMFPLFQSLFTSVGYDVLLSPLTDTSIISRAQNYVTAETCYPVKLIYGHIAWLLENNVDYIVLPRLYTIKHKGSVARKDYSCIYMQTSPLLMEQAFHLKERGVTLIMPELSLQFGKKFMIKSIVSIGKVLNVPKLRMIPSAVKAFANLVAHSNRLEKIGKESLTGNEPVFVLISRVYNIIDPVLNMGIEKYLNDKGCRVIHLEHLEASYMNVVHDYKDMYWPFGQHILTGLKLVKNNKNLYPIYITNHGCGPDTVIQHFFQNEMQGREYLQLEVDEHSSKIGIITRLEAFLFSIHLQNELPLESSKLPCFTETVVSEPDYVLVPEFGIYSSVIEKFIPKGKYGVLRSDVIKNHISINYAMNKEYYSMLITLEEILSAVKNNDEKTGRKNLYDIYFPVDEGSETFGQYALLCQQELQKRGYRIQLHKFYVEDLIKRNDYMEIFLALTEVEKENYTQYSLNNKQKNESPVFVLGEPLCIAKRGICNPEKFASDTNRFLYMPLSEVLLYHMKSVYRKHEYNKQIAEWEKHHINCIKENPELYTSIQDLDNAVKGKLDFCMGNAAKYRFAKLLCLKQDRYKGAVILNSAEENSAIVLKSLTESFKNEISVPFVQFDIDFEHGIEMENLIV